MVQVMAPRLDALTVTVSVTDSPSVMVVELAEMLTDAAFAVCGMHVNTRQSTQMSAAMRRKLFFIE